MCFQRPAVICVFCRGDRFRPLQPPCPEPSGGSNLFLSIPFERSHDDSARVFVRVIPTAGGQVAPFFLSHRWALSTTTGAALAFVHFGGTGAPRVFHTDSIRVELLSGDGKSVLTQTTFPLDFLWVRSDARLVTITADTMAFASVPVELRCSVSVNGRPRMVTTPVSMAVPAGALVTIRPLLGSGGSISDLSIGGWGLDGHSAGRGATLSFRAIGQRVVGAHFVRLRESPR